MFTQCIEWAAVISSIAAVFLASRNNMHTWWTTIVCGTLFAVVFFNVQLYADVTLQVFYLGTAIFAWYHWQKGGVQQTPLPITHVRILPLLFFVLLSVSLAFIYAVVLRIFTNASYPMWDSVILIFSILAQILLMKRKIENWLVWMAADILAVPLYYIKGLNLTAVLYVWFFCNAVYGYLHWRKLMAGQIPSARAVPSAGKA